MRLSPYCRSLRHCFCRGRGLQDDISRRVLDNLSRADAGWAKADIDGRDVRLSGDAPSAGQVDAAIAAVMSTYGVRRVDSAVRVVEPPPSAPTVKPVSGLWGSFAISGTWPEGNGNTLDVGLAGKSYELGQGQGSGLDGAGNWTLSPETELPPGIYDVSASVTSPSGLTSSDGSKDEITVAAPPPELKAPTVAALETRNPSPEIRGTWDPAVAKTLAVTLGPTVYRLGTDPALTATGGDWTLVPPAPLAGRLI